MAQTGYTPISIYYSATASNTPTAGNLVAGELAINTADGKLFYKDSSGVVQTIATKANTLGTYNSITTNQLTIGTTQLGAGNASIMKNRIINGAMVIDQRNAGASVTPTSDGTYTLDRWVLRNTQASKVSIQQNAGSVTPPVGFTNYLGVTSLSAYSVSASDFFNIRQYVEGFNAADLGWGTANAKTVTLSFWVYSSLTGTFGGCINNNAFDRSYPFTYTISSANTWTQINVTIPGSTSGTWLTTNGSGIAVSFGLGIGSTNSGTAGVWASTQYLGATGATSVVGTNGATFYITGVQLEVGSSATGFEYRQYGQELALCQRYFYANASFNMSYTTAANGNQYLTVYYPVTMRANPTYALQSGSWASGTATLDGSTTSSARLGSGSAFYSNGGAVLSFASEL